MDGARPGFRDFDFVPHYRAHYGAGSQPYSFYEFAYRFGYELALNPAYAGKDWLVVDMKARPDWKEKYPDKRWTDFQAAVRFAWQSASARRPYQKVHPEPEPLPSKAKESSVTSSDTYNPTRQLTRED